MLRKTIAELINVYDEFSKVNYKIDFKTLGQKKYGVSEEDIEFVTNSIGHKIIDRNIITPENKYYYLTILLGREETIKRFWEQKFYTYEDIIESIKIMPPCMEKIPKNVLEDKDFIKALFTDNKAVTVMINNANYVPNVICEKPTFKKVLIKYLDKVLGRLDGLNNYDYTNLLYFPKYLCDQPLYQNAVLAKMDDIITRIKDDQSFIHHCPEFLIDNQEFLNKYLTILDVECFDSLPAHVIAKKEVRQKCNRTNRVYNSGQVDKDGYDADWLNKKSGLIQFFTLQNGFPIRSKADYETIYRTYIESKLSPENFCIKYGITPLSGFNSFIKRVGDDDFGKKNEITDIKNRINLEYYNKCREIVQKIINNEMTFEQFIKDDNNDFFVENVNYFYEDVLANDVEKNSFTCSLFDYLEKNRYCLHQNFIDFLNGNKNKYLKNFNYIVYNGFDHNPDNLKRFNSYKKLIEEQKKGYKSELLLCIYTLDGKQYVVDGKVIDQAYAYSVDNDLHLCLKGMESLCKRIVVGDLTYEGKTNIKKEEKVETFMDLLEQAKTMEDYLKKMENNFEKTKKKKYYL